MPHYLKRLSAAPLIAGAIPVAAAGTAMALDITGTDGPDRIIGSRGVDTIAALGGPDRVFALAGNDIIASETGRLRRAGLGDDQVERRGSAAWAGGQRHARLGIGTPCPCRPATTASPPAKATTA